MCLVVRPLNVNEAGGETVVCLVAWPLNDYEAGAAHFLIETSLLCRTVSLTEEPLKSTYTVMMEVSS